MKLKSIVFLIVILLILLAGLLIFTFSINNSNDDKDSSIGINNITANNGSSLAIINLGSNDRGSVDLIGPIGNKDSNVKIAYIIGVHPLESTVHNALYESLIAKNSSLDYCYYIYKIDVTKDADDYDNGRMNGQLLGEEFVVGDVTSKSYDLVIDVHSNQGTQGGNYEETNFIFAPLNDSESKVFADEVISNIPPLVYYYPKSQTSPSYVTIPIMESGIPTLIYETYRYESNEVTLDYINKLINTIDKLKF